MVKRYELTDAQWHRIADLLPGKVGGIHFLAFINLASAIWRLASVMVWMSLDVDTA